MNSLPSNFCTLTIGDLILDEYIYTEPVGISREAPVPVLRETKREYRLGGAANVFMNLRAMALDTPGHFFSFILGKDWADYDLLRKFLDSENPVDFSLITKLHTGKVSKKTRIMSSSTDHNPQQILRLDSGSQEKLSGGMAVWVEKILHRINQYKLIPNAVIVSDYGLGAVNEDMLHMLHRAVPPNTKWFLDSRMITALKFPHSFAYCPNLEEFDDLLPVGGKIKDMMGNFYENHKDIEEILRQEGKRLLDNMWTDHIFLKIGRYGSYLISKSKPICYYGPSGDGKVIDTVGAGDSALAAFVIGTFLDSPDYGAALAMRAGAKAVSEFGTAIVRYDDLDLGKGMAHGL